METRPAFLNDEDFIERIGFAATSIFLLTNGANVLRSAMPINNATAIVISMIMWLIGILLIILALLPRRHPALVLAILLGFIFTVLGAAYTQSSNYAPLTHFSTDNLMIGEYAVDVLEHGQNPYDWDYTDMLRVNRDTLSFTPFVDTAPQHRVTYPALSTEILYLFDRLGLGRGRVVDLTFYLALLVLLFVGADKRYRPLVLLPVFALNDYTSSTLFGVGDIVWSTLLVAMVLAWRRPRLRAVLFGLAASFRQQPWFIAPFLLLLIWDEGETRREKIRACGLFVGISVLMFVGTNLPFALTSPHNWLQSVIEPLYAQFSVDGVGLNALWRFGLVSLNRTFFTALQTGTYLLLLLLYWRHRRAWGMAFWLIPIIYFWLYYRSLTNYWLYWIPPLIIAILSNEYSGFRAAVRNCRAVERPGARLQAVCAVAALFTLSSIYVFQFAGAGSGVEMHFRLPLRTFNWTDPLIGEVNVVVTNHRAQTITPRFFAQRETGAAAYPWLILSGPDQLAAGETGEYRISADGLPRRMIRVDAGGQIVLSDADGLYDAYTTLDIAQQSTFSNPDLVTNPAFAYWALEDNAPTEWQWQTDAPIIVTAADQAVDGRDALSMTLNIPDMSSQLRATRLSQPITFPHDLAVWVYPSDSSDDPAQSAYGLEFDDGVHRLWVLFGHSAQSGELADGTAYIYLDTPAETWTRQVIDLAGMYDHFGWELPSYTRREKNGLAFYTRQVNLSLLCGTQNSQHQCVFGSFEQDAAPWNSAALIESMISHPDEYYFTVAEDYRYQGNYERAADAYRRSLAYNDRNALAYFQLAETLGASGGFDGTNYSPDELQQAVDAYQTAIDLGFPQAALAYKGMGWAQIALQDYENASLALNQAVQNPLLREPGYVWDLANTYEGLAKAFAGQGDETRAARYEALARELALNSVTP